MLVDLVMFFYENKINENEKVDELVPFELEKNV